MTRDRESILRNSIEVLTARKARLDTELAAVRQQLADQRRRYEENAARAQLYAAPPALKIPKAPPGADRSGFRSGVALLIGLAIPLALGLLALILRR
jgi:uncharacterized membrane protein YccC